MKKFGNLVGWGIVAWWFLLLMAFVLIWCADTTFRAMSDWKLYLFNFTAAVVLALPALLLCLRPGRNPWPAAATMAVMMLLTGAVLEANLMYCRTYFTGIPLESYGLASNLGDFTASVRDSMRWGDLILLAIIAQAAIWVWRARREGRFCGSLLPYLISAAVAFAAAAIGVLAKGGFMKEYGRISQSCYTSTCGLPTYTVAGHLLYDALNSPERLTPEVQAEIDSWMAARAELMPWRQMTDTASTRRNLVVVLLESFESWPVEKKICTGAEITPYINSLLKDTSTLFAPNVLTQVAAGRSIDCQLLLTCGLLPMENSVWSMARPQDDYPSLVKALKEDRSAKSAILTSDKPITWNQEVVARSMGYDTLVHRKDWVIDELVGNPAKLSDGSFIRQCVDKLRHNALGIDGKPYMLTLLTYSGHNPFVLPEGLRDPAFDAYACGYPQRMADYVTMAHYTDSSLRVLIDYLRSRPDWGETLVVITGDHEGLAGDRKGIISSGRDGGLVSPLQLTPLIVLNAPRGGRIEPMMGQADIYPALLDMLGLGGYEWKGMGQNALDPGRVPAAISSMTGQWAGDTTATDPRRLDLMRRARTVSDRLIRLVL